MKVIKTLVVFDRGGLVGSEPWVRMHETITGAVQKIVYPPGNSRFLIRRKVPKPHAQGRPSKQWVRNGAAPIRRQFLANLTEAVRQRGGTGDLRSGLANLARATGNLLMVEYPSRRPVGIDDEDFGAFLQHEAGEFDGYFVAGDGLRGVVKLESGKESKAHYTVSKLCSFMRTGLVDCGVMILLSEALAKHIKGTLASWEIIHPYLPVWHRMGGAVERGLFAVLGIEQDELLDA
jgi:hypothetical protein